MNMKKFSCKHTLAGQHRK